MKFGITPPYRANVASDPEWMTYFVRNAESTGFDTVSVVEHVAVPAGFAEEYPYSKTGRWPLPTDCEIPDPLELFTVYVNESCPTKFAGGVYENKPFV